MELDLFLDTLARRGLTYEALAGQLGLDRSEVWSILHGKRYASLTRLLAIAEALSIPPQKAVEAYKHLALDTAAQRIDRQITAVLKTARK
jgi:transcriptional regulator with XRE-family HTH domain